MSSTSGLRAGDTLQEISRLRDLLTGKQRRLRLMRQSRDTWRARARAAEWALRQRRETR